MNLSDKPNLANHHAVLRHHMMKIDKLEQADANLNEILETVTKLYKWFKVSVPVVITAAVTSGVISGKWGAFFAALLG